MINRHRFEGKQLSIGLPRKMRLPLHIKVEFPGAKRSQRPLAGAQDQLLPGACRQGASLSKKPV